VSEEADQLRLASAQEVMGWRQVSIPWAYDGMAQCWESPEAIPVMTCHAWRPDEEDAQCMRVVERMVERGFVCSMEIGPSSVEVVFKKPDVPSHPVKHRERRISLVRAALAALAAESPVSEQSNYDENGCVDDSRGNG